MLDILATPALLDLEAAYARRGHTLRFVGGCVRDLLCCEVPKDIDLHTDATPEEQLALYRDIGVEHHLTGFEHGTLTVVLADGKSYEITSYRKDVATDGRRATVAYSRDLHDDLARRDLTINAMSVGFDESLYDPFGGAEDLAQGVVRFVGAPFDRMVEDGLRILRLLRFHARFGCAGLNPEALAAIPFAADTLKRVSSERIWSELSALVVLDRGPEMLAEAFRLHLPMRIAAPPGGVDVMRARMEVVQGGTRNPITLFVAALGGGVLDAARNLRWSREDAQLGQFLWSMQVARPEGVALNIDYRRLLAVKEVRRDWVAELACLNGDFDQLDAIRGWTIPSFPLTGDDLIATGMTPGPSMGETLRRLRGVWADHNYHTDKAHLLRTLEP